MITADAFLQQLINGLSLGAMYAILALGFTIVYGILQLVNFAHFSIFMIGSFVAMGILHLFGLEGQSVTLAGLTLVAVLLVTLALTMLACGTLGVLVERIALRPLRGCSGSVGMITTIGVSFILSNIVLLAAGADSKNFPDPLPRFAFNLEGASLHLREILVWLVAVVIMVGLWFFVQRAKLGKAMRATAQDAEAARMMGVDVDRVIMTSFFIGSALAGAAGMIFGLYYGFTSVQIGVAAGLRAFTAAVLGGIGSVPGAMVGGLVVGLIEAFGGQLISTAWSDVIIFLTLVTVLIFKPSGLLGRVAPDKS